MKMLLRISTVLYGAALAALFSGTQPLDANPASSPRIVLSADADWGFILGDPAGAELPAFDAQSWRTLSLPHDWSIEAAPAEKASTGAGGGYYPAGIGWYRKAFTAPASWKGKRVNLEFDGVSGDSSFYLNGKKLGTHPYAYTSFHFDITDQLILNAKNVLAVRADNSLQPARRWYSGAGIYRHVRVVVTDPIYLASWGVFVSTPEPSSASARIVVKTQVKNDSTEAASVSVKTIVVGQKGVKFTAPDKAVELQPGQSVEADQEVVANQPPLWSPQSPNLYRAVIQIVKNGKRIDEVETSFGIRSLAWLGLNQFGQCLCPFLT